MNIREQEIVRLALVYLQANREDVIDAFQEPEAPDGVLSFNGEMIAGPTEDEIEALLKLFQ